MHRPNPAILLAMMMLAAGCPTTTDGNTSSSSGGGGGASSSSSVGGSSAGSGGSSASGSSSAGSMDGGVSADGGAPQGAARLMAAPATARSCEVMLEDPQGVVVGVLDTEAMRGRALSRGGKAAVAFAATSDMALSTDGIALVLHGTSASTDGLRVLGARCFDAQGRAISGSSVTLATDL